MVVNAVVRGVLGTRRVPFFCCHFMLWPDPRPGCNKRHVKHVLVKLLEHQLPIKREKCEFHVPQVSFLGYIISNVAMHQTTVNTVKEWPIPHMIQELQGFLGFANFYGRFIQGISSIASPLTLLLKKLTWNKPSNQASPIWKRHSPLPPF